MASSRTESRLDGLAARLVAGLVLLAVAGALLAIHWSDLFPGPEVQAVDPADPAAACIAERSAQIETLIAENPDMAGQKELFLERAVAMCRSTQGGNGGAPRLPGS